MKSSRDIREHEANLGELGSEALQLTDRERDSLQEGVFEQALVADHLTAYQIEWAIFISAGYI